jgi:F-type H+-transporting ATPase subunit c
MLEAGKMIAAGIASLGLLGGAIGAGLVFSSLVAGVAKNPSLKAQLFSLTILGFALIEALALFSCAPFNFN